jgi:YVTN family beta-propeller protein
VSVIDASRQEPLSTILLGEGVKPMGLAMNKAGSRLYVSTGRSKKVFVLDTATNAITTSFEVGQRPWGIELSPDDKLLFTANGPSNDVSIVNATSGAIVRKVKAGDRPWGVVVVPRN